MLALEEGREKVPCTDRNNYLEKLNLDPFFYETQALEDSVE